MLSTYISAYLGAVASAASRKPASILFVILEEGQDALYCEGDCISVGMHHRWCASVTKERYATLSTTDDPLLCPTCTYTFADRQKAIAGLQGSVLALADEVHLLKATIRSRRCLMLPCRWRHWPVVPTSSCTTVQNLRRMKAGRRLWVREGCEEIRSWLRGKGSKEMLSSVGEFSRETDCPSHRGNEHQCACSRSHPLGIGWPRLTQ